MLVSPAANFDVATSVDDTVNDNDKTFVVPAGNLWNPLGIYISWASTATAGNRQITINFTDEADLVLSRALAGIVQPISVTYQYTLGRNYPLSTALIGGTDLFIPMPDLILPAGFKVRVFDSANVDVNDDSLVRLVNRVFKPHGF